MQITSNLDPNNCFSAQNITRFNSILDGPKSVDQLLGRLNRSSQTSGFIRKRRNRLIDTDGHSPFKIVGPNIYWLGLDENVSPSPSYPSQARVLEVMATAAMMGSIGFPWKISTSQWRVANLYFFLTYVKNNRRTGNSLSLNQHARASCGQVNYPRHLSGQPFIRLAYEEYDQ